MGPKHKAVKEGDCRFFFLRRKSSNSVRAQDQETGISRKGNALESNPCQTANTNIHLFDINRDQQTQIMCRQ